MKSPVSPSPFLPVLPQLIKSPYKTDTFFFKDTQAKLGELLYFAGKIKPLGRRCFYEKD